MASPPRPRDDCHKNTRADKCSVPVAQRDKSNKTTIPSTTSTHKMMNTTSPSPIFVNRAPRDTPSSPSSNSNSLVHPHSMAVPRLLPRLNRILLPSHRDVGIARAMDEQDVDALFAWQLPFPPDLNTEQQAQARQQQQGNTNEITSPTKTGTHDDTSSLAKTQQQWRHPIHDAFSLLLTQKLPSVRFATYDEICFYETIPPGVNTSDSIEEGFQMDHVFDDIETVTATAPMAPPRRCPSIESLDSIENHDCDDTEQDITLVHTRAGMPRHGSVESETTLSFSGLGDCCSSTQDDEEDTLSDESSLAEEICSAARGMGSPQGAMENGDDSLIREIMESLRVGATTSDDDADEKLRSQEDLRTCR